MLLNKWFPFNDIERTLDEMDRMFGSLSSPLALRSVPKGTFPAINIYDYNGRLIVRAEVPGVDPGKLDISIVENMLTLKGSRNSEQTDENIKYYRRERVYGEFERTITLPVPVDVDQVKAKVCDGILEISMPKAQEAKPKTIKINQ